MTSELSVDDFTTPLVVCVAIVADFLAGAAAFFAVDAVWAKPTIGIVIIATNAAALRKLRIVVEPPAPRLIARRSISCDGGDALMKRGLNLFKEDGKDRA